MSLQAGLILADKYEVVRAITSGGMGSIYEARVVTDGGRRVALKQMLQHLMEGEQAQLFKSKFENEVAFLKNLNHPGIPRLYDSFVFEGTFYIVMEFIVGRNLEQELEERLQLTGETFSMDQLVRDTRQVLEILAYLHGQSPPLVHRDIKPANLIREHPSGRIKLVDFGMARLLSETNVAQTQLGTLGYSPLEQLQGSAEQRSDIYALGATMHHLVTGEMPKVLNIAPVLQLKPELDMALAAVIDRACATDIHLRFATAREMLRAIDELGPNFPSASESSFKLESLPRFDDSPSAPAPAPTAPAMVAPAMVAPALAAPALAATPLGAAASSPPLPAAPPAPLAPSAPSAPSAPLAAVAAPPGLALARNGSEPPTHAVIAAAPAPVQAAQAAPTLPPPMEMAAEPLQSEETLVIPELDSETVRVDKPFRLRRTNWTPAHTVGVSLLVGGLAFLFGWGLGNKPMAVNTPTASPTPSPNTEVASSSPAPVEPRPATRPLAVVQTRPAARPTPKPAPARPVPPPRRPPPPPAPEEAPQSFSLEGPSYPTTQSASAGGSSGGGTVATSEVLTLMDATSHLQVDLGSDWSRVGRIEQRGYFLRSFRKQLGDTDITFDIKGYTTENPILTCRNSFRADHPGWDAVRDISGADLAFVRTGRTEVRYEFLVAKRGHFYWFGFKGKGRGMRPDLVRRELNESWDKVSVVD